MAPSTQQTSAKSPKHLQIGLLGRDIRIAYLDVARTTHLRLHACATSLGSATVGVVSGHRSTPYYVGVQQPQTLFIATLGGAQGTSPSCWHGT